MATKYCSFYCVFHDESIEVFIVGSTASIAVPIVTSTVASCIMGDIVPAGVMSFIVTSIGASIFSSIASPTLASYFSSIVDSIVNSKIKTINIEIHVYFRSNHRNMNKIDMHI